METSKPKKKLGINEAYLKAAAFCAYQERTQQEVRFKIIEYGIYGDDLENMIVRLIGENFINEERFAKAYASGKFRNKKWGRLKIKAGLKFEGLSEYCIKKGLAEIPADDYDQTMLKVFEIRSKVEKEKNVLKRKFKLANYMISRGFEADLVWEVVNNVTDVE